MGHSKRTRRDLPDLLGIKQVSVILLPGRSSVNLAQVLSDLPPAVTEVIWPIACGAEMVGSSLITHRSQAFRDALRRLRPVPTTGSSRWHALRDGARAAQGDFLVFLDADGAIESADVRSVFGTLLSGANIATGSRVAQGGATNPHEPFFSQLACRWHRYWLNALFGAQFSDCGAGCFAIRAQVFEQIAPERHVADTLLLPLILARALAAGLHVSETPVRARDIPGSTAAGFAPVTDLINLAAIRLAQPMLARSAGRAGAGTR